MLEEALEQEADAFLTGEMGYHDFFGLEQRVQIGVLGHWESEQYTVELLRDKMQDWFPHLPVYMTEVVTNPVRYLI